MKLKNIGRAALATGMSLAIGFGATACSRDYTAAYIYTTSATNATVSAFAVDYQTGALTQISGSPFSGAGRNPVTLVASPNGKYIYTINHDDSDVTVFSVGSDGKLYGQQTPSLSPTVNGAVTPGGSYPTAAAIDSTGAFLYVAFTYQPGYTPTSPGKGGITIFPIVQSGSTAGQLETPLTVNGLDFVPAGNNPVAIAVSAPFCATSPVLPPAATATAGSSLACGSATGSGSNVFVYVADQEASPNAALLGFVQDSTGALIPLSGTTCNTTAGALCQGYHAGVTPSAIAIDPTARYVYVTDETSNQIIGYSIAENIGSLGGNLTPLVSSPFSTGLYPISLTIDPRGQYVLTANYNSQTISSFTIDYATGALGGVASTGSATVGTGPTCITVEPDLGKYVYTSNSLDNSISAEVLDANTGGLSAIANTPFPTAILPSCVVSVANGSHAQSIVNP